MDDGEKGIKRVEIVAVSEATNNCYICKHSSWKVSTDATYLSRHHNQMLSEGPADWLISHTENHWANETTTIAYIQHIIIPYVKKERESLGLSK